MSRYSKQTLQKLRNRIDITQLIKTLDIPWKVRDDYFRFLCPLCSEFLTACHPKTNLARCFRCEQNFNPIDLIMAIKGCGFQEAVQFLQNLGLEETHVGKGNA